jgi:uncharacterized membrane protein YesL
MQENTFMDRLNTIFMWISRLAFLNMLWIAFSAIGLFLFGFFPATAAMLAICNKWLKAEGEIRIFKEFSTFYKESFWATNRIGYILAAASIILYLNFLVIREYGSSLVFISAFYLMVFFTMAAATHILPLYIYEKSSFIPLAKKAFIISIINLPYSIAILVSQSAIYYWLFTYPASAVFFLGSLLAIIQMWIANRSFIRLEKRAKQKTNLTGIHLSRNEMNKNPIFFLKK